MPGGTKESVIIDCDPGVDDTLALILALTSEVVEVKAVTIVFGNSFDTEVLAENARNILKMCDKSCPVVIGASNPVNEPFHGWGGVLVHGGNALGGVCVGPESLAEQSVRAEGEAADFIADECAKAPGKITVVCLGPLTNLATAVTRHPDLATNVKRIVLMGGTVDGDGNASPAAEANFLNDPEGAAIVFSSFADITMAGLNVTRQLGLPCLRERIKELNEAGRFFHSISEHYVKQLEEWGNQTYIHDPTAILSITHPELFETRKAYIVVETKGEYTRGVAVADWRGFWDKVPQTTVLMKVDVEKAYDAILYLVGQVKDECVLALSPQLFPRDHPRRKRELAAEALAKKNLSSR